MVSGWPILRWSEISDCFHFPGLERKTEAIGREGRRDWVPGDCFFDAIIFRVISYVSECFLFETFWKLLLKKQIGVQLSRVFFECLRHCSTGQISALPTQLCFSRILLFCAWGIATLCFDYSPSGLPSLLDRKDFYVKIHYSWVLQLRPEVLYPDFSVLTFTQVLRPYFYVHSFMSSRQIQANR